MSVAPLSASCLVAHRGDAHRFPENTWPAFESALALGLTHLEFDLQASADGVPLVIHDPTLDRTAGRGGDVRALDAATLAAITVGEPARFGAAHAATPLLTLAALSTRLAAHPGLTLFAELKVESFAHLGRQRFLDAVLAALDPVRSMSVLISFDAEVLQGARAAGQRIGWCAPDASAASRARAEALAPEHLFGDVTDFDHPAVADAPLWPGPWSWAIYEVADLATARRYRARGAALLETMRPASLLAARGSGA
jgi:glycerophosphoryl diester phosphodiesterase